MSKLWCYFIFGLLLVTSSRAGDLGVYQMILDKQLLGVEKAVPPPVRETEVVQAAPSWSREYRMTMMTQDEGGIRVGIQNIRDQSAFLLVEGDDSDSDFQLVTGDFNLGTARIRFRGAEHRFTLEDGPAGTPRAERPTSQVPGSSPAVRNRRVIRPISPPDVTTPRPQVREFKSREELQSHLQEQQMDAIRTGKPPLPIPLTPMMDDQLVKEGVLPALE